MCGSLRTYQNLGSLYTRTVDETSYRRDELRVSPGVGTGIDQEVKLRYSRGEIDSATYHRLMEIAQRRQLGWDDLNQVEKKFAPPAVRQPVPHKRDAEIVGQLNKLYSHRKQLEKSRLETENVLRALEKEVLRLQSQAKDAEEKAKHTIANEESARAYLITRQEALEHAGALEVRMDDLRANLHRLESLEVDLAVREAELKALESGEQLAELEASIRQDLLGDN